MVKLGYFRLDDEAVAFWESDSGDPMIDVDRKTGRRHVLCWRSDYSKPRPATAEEIKSLRPVTQAQWIEFQRSGRW